MMNRTTFFALCAVFIGSGTAWSAGKLTTDQVELCGEDAVKLCGSPDNIVRVRTCLLRRIKEVTPSCAYLLKRADIR
jgi:hypothetical protein